MAVDRRGGHWTELSKGLPEDGFYSCVMRDAMTADTADPTGLYLGTRDGSVFASNDGGDSWSQVTEHLPDVMCVRAAVVSSDRVVGSRHG